MMPTTPKPATVVFAVLEILRRGETLTQTDALRLGLGWRLSARIHYLRERGWDIRSTKVYTSHGGPAISLYWLPAKG
jgi:hypothetical protein